MILVECKTCGRHWYPAVEGQVLADDVCCVASLAAMRDPEDDEDEDDTPLIEGDDPDDYIVIDEPKPAEQNNG